MASTLQELRKADGYKSARDFADAAGIPANTYARYESKPETIPYERAAQIADLLECTLDEVYGREAPDTSDKRGDFQKLYDGLSDDGQLLLDQFAAIIKARDNMAAKRRRSEEERKFEDYARYYERLFTQEAESSEKLGDVVIFGSEAQKRAAFKDFVERRAAAARVSRLEESVDAEYARMRVERGFAAVDENGVGRDTGKRAPKEFWDMEDDIEEFRASEDRRLREEDEKTVSQIVAAYDRLHDLLDGGPAFQWQAADAGFEYHGPSLFIGYDSDGRRVEEGGGADN